MVQKPSKTNTNNNNTDINDLENKIRHIFQGSRHDAYLDSIFKKMSTNLQNVKVFYEFLITEHNIQNVMLNTTLTHVKTFIII